LAVAIITGIALTMVPLFFIKGGIAVNLPAFLNSLTNFNDDFASTGKNIFFGTSFATLVNSLAAIISPSMKDFSFLVPIETTVSIILLVGSVPAFFVLRRKWERVMMITLLMIYIQNMSGLYNLTFMLLPLLLFLTDEERTEYDSISFLLLAVLWIPKEYHYFKNDNIPYSYIPLGVMINSVIILLYIVYIDVRVVFSAIKGLKYIRHE